MGFVLMPTPQYVGAGPTASLLKNQIPLGIAPDGLINPCVNIMLISNQHIDPTENISREEAVIAYTLGNAFAEFAENEKGTLTRGKLADLAILTHDIFTIPVEQLPEVRSILTMVDGKIVYRAYRNVVFLPPVPYAKHLFLCYHNIIKSAGYSSRSLGYLPGYGGRIMLFEFPSARKNIIDFY